MPQENVKGEDAAIKAAGIMYLDGNSVLLLKRAGAGNYAGTWAFPGGKIEENEIPEQAAIRESNEETAHIPNNALLQIDCTKNPDVEFTTFLCITPRFTPVLNDEHDGYVWADLGDLPYPLHPGVQKTLLEYSQSKLPQAAMDNEGSAQRKDINGYITIESNPISRSGIFQYLGKSISKDAIPDRVYNVYRPPEELEKPEAIESFKLIPFVDEHDMLGVDKGKLLTPEAKGVQGSTGENVVFKDGVLYATLKIFSQTLANMIKMGKRELSLGYWCKFIKQAGTFNGQAYDYIQVNLRGNHLALVNDARCDVAVLDQQMAFDHFDLALDTEELNKMADENTKGDTKEKPGDQKDSASKEMTLSEAHALMQEILPKVAKMQTLLEKHTGTKEDEKEGEKTDPAADNADFKPTTGPCMPKLATDSEEKDKMEKAAKDMDDKEEKKAMDASIKSLTATVASLQKDGLKSIVREVAQRDQLANSLAGFIGTFDHSEMTRSEVAAYGIEKLGLKCSAGQEEAALAGFLHDRKPATMGFSMDSNTGGAKKGKYAASKNKAA